MKLNLASGHKPLEGYINLDMAKLPGIDVRHKYTGILPFKDDSFEEIYCSHFMEHIPDLVTLMNECHRVMKPKGRLRVLVPWWAGEWALGDPTHVKMFNHMTFDPFSDRYDDYKVMMNLRGKWNKVKTEYNVQPKFDTSKRRAGFSDIVEMDIELEKNESI